MLVQDGIRYLGVNAKFAKMWQSKWKQIFESCILRVILSDLVNACIRAQSIMSRGLR